MNKIYGLFIVVFMVGAIAACKASAATSNNSRYSASITITEEDALMRQIARCWNVPASGPMLQVKISIDVNPDRTISNAKIIDDEQHANDPYYKAMAKSAMLALQNPKCSPLELPTDKYDQWKHIELTFDPRTML